MAVRINLNAYMENTKEITPIKGLKLTKLQKKIYNSCKLDSEYNIIVCSCGRQVGKSSVASQIVLNWCINNNGYKVGYFSPTYKQCKEQFNRIERGLSKIRGITCNKTDLIIYFPNGSYCQFQTADNDNMRGSTYHSLVVDEACFVKDEIFTAGILPTVAVSLSKKNGKVLLISTPKSKNWFYQYFKKSEEGKISITATSEEGGLISKQLLKQIKSSTPEHIYKNEYLAEFLDDGQGVFKYTKCILDGSKKITYDGCVAGIDFGMENDYTVLAVINKHHEVVAIKRWRGLDWDEMLREISNWLRYYNVQNAYAETNGIGNMPFKTLKKLFPNTRGWITTNKSKVDIINKLSYDFSNGLISIPNIDYLLTELDAFTVEYTQHTGKTTYKARNGFNDDCVMALAIANWNVKMSGKRFTIA